MRILKFAIAAGLLLGTPALAQQAAPAAQAGMSEDGKKIVMDHMARRSQQIEPLLQRKRQLQAQFDGLLTAETYDEARLAETMAAMREVEGQLFDAMGSTMLALLKALPPQDRAAFMKSISKTPPSAAARAGAGR